MKSSNENSERRSTFGLVFVWYVDPFFESWKDGYTHSVDGIKFDVYGAKRDGVILWSIKTTLLAEFSGEEMELNSTHFAEVFGFVDKTLEENFTFYWNWIRVGAVVLINDENDSK